MVVGTDPYDIVLDGDLGLMLWREPDQRTGRPTPAIVRSKWGPADESSRQPEDDVGIVFDDWSGGMGHSRRWNDKRNVYAFGNNVITWIPRIIMPSGALTEITLDWTGGSAAAVVDSSEWTIGSSRVVYAVANSATILKITAGAATASVATASFAAAPTWVGRSIAAFNGTLYAGGDGGICKLNTSTGAWTAYAVDRRLLATNYWQVAGIGKFVLIGTDTATSMKYTDGDPTDSSAWSSPTTVGGTNSVGNSSWPIHSLAKSNRVVMFATEGGIHTVDGRGYSPNLTPGWEETPSTNNGVACLVHEGMVFAANDLGLEMVDLNNRDRVDDPAHAEPGLGLPNETPIFGRCTALARHAGWVLAAFYNGTDSYILRGKSRRKLGIEGPGPMVWHGAEAKFSSQIVTHMRVSSSSGRPKLLIFTADYTNPVSPYTRAYWQDLPKTANAYQDWSNLGGMQFNTSWTLYQSIEDWDDASARKVPRRFDLTSENLNVARTVAVLASAEGGAYVTQGTAQASPRQSFLPSTGVTTGYQIGLGMAGTGTATQPAMVRTLKARAEVLVDQVERRQYTVVFGDGVRLKSGLDTRDPIAILSRLEALQNAGPVTFANELGQTNLTVKVKRGVESELRETGDGYDIKCTFWLSVLRRPLYFDQGESLDAEFVWS